MSSEHATEKVALKQIQEGDTILDAGSGDWITIVSTDSGTTTVSHPGSGEPETVEDYRIYYGDHGEVIDSRLLTGLVSRQVRE
jgi:hypothetical protein